MHLKRILPLLCAAVFGLAACQDPTSADRPTNDSDEGGSFAMRISPQVVAAAQSSSDSVRLRIVPLVAGGPAVSQTWPLKEGELLFEQLPPGRCSIYVVLFNKSNATLYTGASVVDIRAGRTVSSDIGLTPTTGSLSVNLRIDQALVNVDDPVASPAGGYFQSAFNVTLTHPVATTRIQYRLENATTGSTPTWVNYAGSFTVSQSSVLYVRAINGVDTGSHRTYNYFVGSSTIINTFESAYSSTTGWNGSVWTNPGSSVTGSRVVPGPWGTASAQIRYSLSGTSYTGYFGATFNAPSGIAWSRFSTLRIKVRSSMTRAMTIEIAATLPEYLTANQSGGWLQKTIQVGPTTNEFVIPAADFTYPAYSSGVKPPLASVLPTVTGFDIVGMCSGNTGSCTSESGTIEIDDILIDLK